MKGKALAKGKGVGKSAARGKHELRYEVPPVRCAIVVLLVIITAIAWLFRLFGITWEQWAPLKWLCTVPLAILVLIFLPSIIARLRKLSEWRE